MEYTTLHNGAKMPMLGYGTMGRKGGRSSKTSPLPCTTGMG